jgi:acetyltransferase-like isoleucine patch superfamily enzyme
MLKQFFGKIKITFKVLFVYPSKYKGSYISSYIPPTLKVGDQLIIEEDVSISNTLKSIGKGTYIGCRSVIGNCEKIGMYCSISKDVKLGMSNHPLDLTSTSPRFYLKKYEKVNSDLYDHSMIKKTILKDDVLISSNVVVLENVVIGRGAVVAAGAVVTEDVQPYSVVGGIPAKHLKYRFTQEKIEQLLKLDYSNDKEIIDFK